MRHNFFACLSGLATIVAGAMVAGAVENPPVDGNKEVAAARNAIERGLAFLEKDAARWREERKCSTCHHGLMTVWAYLEARQRGFAIAPETVADNMKWTKDRLLERIDLPRDTRPGWSMVNTPAIYLAVMAQGVPKQDVVSAEELKRIADHLVRHHESDGSWVWSSAPPKNRPPPFFESDEVATRLAYIALAPHVPRVAEAPSTTRESLQKAHDWLSKSPSEVTTQAAAIRLWMSVRANEPAEKIRSQITDLLHRQNEDGGWGQLDDLPSDAYATGQALYVLSVSHVATDHPNVQRAVKYLIAGQEEDGSWPITPRSHPGATPSANTTPITYFGSAWGTIGLLRSIPPSDAKLP